ncbi:helix-turn-helix transcriptional regulator [Wenjunlia tyrosinilytica]|uniref:HTH luxR-type domain-containing protein n=1 Tax=Wenjunlia tyrosinilytica TaxID=1544741 RepID=A0A917ZW08_9ACTN|nr:LuxR C-terminal-related transcriptional regulator [Wenjunlia tyrosinilytica]GGO96012.1 hypothetical protein GCM10012280_54550 [Wenjunlia tyrosinilytica]
MAEIAADTGVVSPAEERLGVAVFVENELLRLGLQGMLLSLRSTKFVRLCASPTDLAEVITDERIGVVLVASSNRSLRSMDLTVRRSSLPRVLVLLDAFQAGQDGDLTIVPADGYILREDLTALALDRALAQMSRGEMPMPRRLGRQLLDVAASPNHAARARNVKLTTREHEALAQMVAGMSNRQIARHLSISEHGAKRLVGKVLLKLGAENRTSAVVTALKMGLVR